MFFCAYVSDLLRGSNYWSNRSKSYCFWVALRSKGKGGEDLRTHIRNKIVLNVLCNKAKKIGDLLLPYTFRHLYAKVSSAAGIPKTMITSAMGNTKEVHHQSYARFITDGTVALYTKRNARVA